MRNYEALYIIDVKLTEEESQNIIDRYKKIVTDAGGSILSAEKWEKRKLAYEIDKHKEGQYILMQFEADSTVPQELNRVMRISDDVIRHRIFLQENASKIQTESTTNI